MARSYDIVVVGAGLAGASTAYHLSRRDGASVLLLDREPQAGVHSSGRNAAISRQVVDDPALASLARESVAWMASQDAGWGGSPQLLDPDGLLLFHSGSEEERFQAIAETSRTCGVPIEILNSESAIELQPALEGAVIADALLSPTDGVVDVHALLHGFLRGAEDAGATTRLGCDCIGIDIGRNGVEAVITDKGRIPTGALVLAAGAWAGQIAERARVPSLPLRVTSRHLFVSGPLEMQPGPVVWRLGDELYFRRESGGLLLSPCDLSDHSATMPGTDLGARELLLSKLDAGFPALRDLQILRSWAGLRILTPDGRHMLGKDPRCDGLYWAAGLGGHGVTTAWGTGRIVADAVLDGKEDPAFAPSRFADCNVELDLS